jgi:hypothetical protein
MIPNQSITGNTPGQENTLKKLVAGDLKVNSTKSFKIKRISFGR